MQAAQLLGEAAKPARVILFGSYARGDAGEESDLDFLVVEPTLLDKFGEMVRLHQVLRPLRIAADVLVCSQASRVGNFFAHADNETVGGQILPTLPNHQA